MSVQTANVPVFQKKGSFSEEYGLNVYFDNGFPLGVDQSPELIASMRNFPFQADDVLIVGYPKSGTNWLQIMVTSLYAHWSNLEICNGIVPQFEMLDAGDDFLAHDTCLRLKTPRLIKSHQPVQYTPLPKGRYKIIYIDRNPKDICVSFFHELKAQEWVTNFTMSWDEWVEHFVEGKTLFGPWVDYVLGWRRLDVRDDVLCLNYDEVRYNVAPTLRMIANFLGKPVSDDKIAKVVEDTSFEAMRKKGPAESKINAFNKARSKPFLRKGTVGDWKNQFTVAQSEWFDATIGRRLKEAGVDFPAAEFR